MARLPKPFVSEAGTAYTPRQIAAIAIVAQVDPRTVRRHLEGYATLAPVGAAIRAALERSASPPIEDVEVLFVSKNTIP